MIVIKLGGSLAQAGTLQQCLQRIQENYANQSLVIVPGGGAFADTVRISQQYWQFDERTAHEMAILAMQQMALLMRGLQTDFVIAHSIAAIRTVLPQKKILIWSPAIQELNAAGIPATWDISSDSLAAWLAHVLAADELIVVKSANVDYSLPLAELSEQGIVDKAFGDFAALLTGKIRLVSVQQF